MSDDGGQAWRASGAGFPVPRSDSFANAISILAVAPTDSSILFASDRGGLFVDGEARLPRSMDGGETWGSIDSPGDVLDLLIDPRDPNRVLAGLHSAGGVFLSADLGAHFDRRLGGRLDVLVRAPSNPDVLYAWIAPYSTPPGKSNLCRSTDGGGSWDCAGTLLAAGLTVTELAVDPRAPSRVLLAVLAGGVNGAPVVTRIYETTDGGATLAPIAPAFGDGVVATDLAFDPRDPSVVWAATLYGGVLRSADGGHTWEPVNRGLTDPDVYELAFDPTGRVLVAATGAGAFRLSATGGPAPPTGVPWIEDAAVSGFRVKVRIDQGGGRSIPGTEAPACIPETVCVAGALPDRAEVFVRIVGPKPNGRLWPTLVKFSTSRIEIWIQQLSTGELRYYELSGASSGVDELPGLFDRDGFLPD